MGAMGAMKVGDDRDLACRAEIEEEEVGGEEDERAEEVGGEEATGRTGVRKEMGEAEDGALGGTAPPVAGAEGLAEAAVAAAGGEGGRTAARAKEGLMGGAVATQAGLGALFCWASREWILAGGAVEGLSATSGVDAVEVVGGGAKPGGGAGEAGLGGLPSEGANAWTSSTGLFC